MPTVRAIVAASDTTQLLEEQVVELKIVDRASDNTGAVTGDCRECLRGMSGGAHSGSAGASAYPELPDSRCAQQRAVRNQPGGYPARGLSNLVLDELDRELERRGHRFVRYADEEGMKFTYFELMP
jgi:hypothetical protein